MTDKIPAHVVAKVNSSVLPAMKAWMKAERIDPSTISHISVQAHENRRDWVMKVHMEHDRMRIFPIVFPVVN